MKKTEAESLVSTLRALWVEGRVYQVLKQCDFQRSHLKTITLEAGHCRREWGGGKGMCVCVCVCLCVCVHMCTCVPYTLSYVRLFASFSAMGTLQARFLDWVAIPISRDLPIPRIKYVSPVSCWQEDSLPLCHLGSPVT